MQLVQQHAQVYIGATYLNIDVLNIEIDIGSNMLMVEGTTFLPPRVSIPRFQYFL